MKQPRITLALSKPALAMLQKLAATGLYGRNPAAVARGFLYEGLRKHSVEYGDLRRR